MTFQDLNLHRNILQVLEEEKYITPTPIQQQAIPIILEEHDLVGCAQTGTGKTFVGLKIAELLLKNSMFWKTELNKSPILFINGRGNQRE